MNIDLGPLQAAKQASFPELGFAGGQLPEEALLSKQNHLDSNRYE
jgi:hypothetical protein